jgi:hypothetical protein
MIIHELLPRQGVGDVRFHSSTQVLKKLGYAEDIDGFDEILRWHTYTKHEGLHCYVKQGKLICIKCITNCYFGGEDLIGKTAEALISIVGNPDEIGEPLWIDDSTQQITFEFFEPGLQIWLEAGKVIFVFCNDNY